MDTISEQEFKALCEEVYSDRQLIYSYHPNASRREALMWMLLACLVSLLSVPQDEQPNAFSEASEDPYGDAVYELLKGRVQPAFNPRPYLEELSKRLEE